MNRACPKFIKPVLCGTWLKIIAIISMICDHAAVEFLAQGDPLRLYLRSFGRIAFPIYCFLLVEGAFKTSNIKKYATRLFIFALISEVPFDLVVYKSFWYIQKQNVFFTLFFGLIMVYILQKTQNAILMLIGTFACGFAAYFLKTDYGIWGVALILAFYIATVNPVSGLILFAVLMIFKGGIEYWGIASLIVILLYNGQRGKQMGHVLYLVYPIHLLLLHIIWCLTNGTSIFAF